MSFSKKSRGKLRLYVALYARAAGGRPKMHNREDTYHWALILGPKNESFRGGTGIKMHAHDRVRVENDQIVQTFKYEELETSLAAVDMIVVRVLVAKVPENKKGPLLGIVRNLTIGIREEGWNCVSFVQDALKALDADGTVLSERAVVEWVTVRDGAMRYAEAKKKQHRFDGKGIFDMSKVPTWDLISATEAVG